MKEESLYDIPPGCICLGDGLMGMRCDAPQHARLRTPSPSHAQGCICLNCKLDQAERKAWDSLGRYKFQMFGYWAAIWVHLNRIGQFKRANPWTDLVRAARLHKHSSATESHPCPSCGAEVPTERWSEFAGICAGCAAAIGELPA